MLAVLHSNALLTVVPDVVYSKSLAYRNVIMIIAPNEQQEGDENVTKSLHRNRLQIATTYSDITYGRKALAGKREHHF